MAVKLNDKTVIAVSVLQKKSIVGEKLQLEQWRTYFKRLFLILLIILTSGFGSAEDQGMEQ
jgi:hypothetical protein